jgi:MFS family permease
MTNRWSILAVLFFARMAMAFQFQAVAALAPLIEDSYGASLADIGLLIGLYFAPGIAFAIPGSALAARLGERRVVVAAMILMLLGGALMWAGTDWAALVSGRLVAGIGGAIINVLLTKLLVDWFVGREISTAMAVFVNSWPVGIALALLVLPHAAAGGLASAWGAVLLLIAAALVLFVIGHRAPDSGASAAHVVRTRRLPLGAVVLAGWIWAFYNAAIGMVFSFGPVLLVARGQSLAAASSVTSLYLVLMAISVPLGGVIADRTGRRDVVIAASLAGFGVLLAAAVWLPVGWVPAAFVVMGLISGLAAGPVMGLPSLVLSPQARAFGMGVFFTIYYAVFMVAPMFAGWLADLAGDAAMPFMLGVLMLLSCLAALWWFRRAAVAARATTAR